jgi:hypothetical protein
VHPLAQGVLRAGRSRPHPRLGAAHLVWWAAYGKTLNTHRTTQGHHLHNEQLLG